MHGKLDEAGTPTLRGERVPNHECYAHVRRNVIELLAAPRPVADPVVPACPEWTLRDLVTHLVGVAAATVGRLSGRLSPQPSSSADMDLTELPPPTGPDNRTPPEVAVDEV